jgi:hypothetical protein
VLRLAPRSADSMSRKSSISVKSEFLAWRATAQALHR